MGSQGANAKVGLGGGKHGLLGTCFSFGVSSEPIFTVGQAFVGPAKSFAIKHHTRGAGMHEGLDVSAFAGSEEVFGPDDINFFVFAGWSPNACFGGYVNHVITIFNGGFDGGGIADIAGAEFE